MQLIRGMPPVTPDPKMHMKMSLSGNGIGSTSVLNSWFEAEQRHKDFSDLKAHELASPMFMPGIIKESPRMPPHLTHSIFNRSQPAGQNPSNYNITVNYNDYSNRMPAGVSLQHPSYP